MAPADRGMVEALRDSYREPRVLPGHAIIALGHRTLALGRVTDCHRMTLRFMRRVETGFEV